MVILALLAVPVDSPTAVTKSPTDPKVLQQFESLRSYISGLTQNILASGQKKSLTAKLNNSEAAYSRGQPCTALNILDAYLNETQALRRGSFVATADQLYASGRSLQHNLDGVLPEGLRCPGHERITNDVSVEVLEFDNTHVRGRISFGEATMWTVSAGREQFTKVMIPGLSLIGQPGLPGVPVVQRTIAVPHGASLQVYAANPTVAETVRVNLYPFQDLPVDQIQHTPGDFGDPPFFKDNSAYASHGPFPPSICNTTILGQMRDLTIAHLTCAAGHYDPVDDVLTLFESLDFEVRFEGGNGYFITQQTFNPFEPALLGSAPLMQVLNWPDVVKHVDYNPSDRICYGHGEELLIFTPPDLKPAADKLANWKKQKGIMTSVVVFDPNDTTGSTPPVRSKEEINSYVKSRYDRCSVRPSYILLFGDAGRIPTWYKPTLHSYFSATDYPYAIGNNPPSFVALAIAPPPSFAVGRIPVYDLSQAEAVVAKIIGYEKTPPPSDDSFYSNASILARFECCKYMDFPLGSGGIGYNLGWDQRSFVETAEFARNVLTNHGYTAERIYTEYVDKDHYSKDSTPRRYEDGSDLPADLAPKSGFTWIKSGSDDAKIPVISAFNTGRFLILERDHGSPNGWASWQISREDVNGLTNGALLPVVFSMSCSTALFDSETNPAPWEEYPHNSSDADETYFAERLIRHPSGGAIGVIGATRDSSSVSGDVLTRGLFDAVWPGDLGSTAKQRLGDILNHAKLYLLSQKGKVTAWQTAWHDDMYLFHVIGDPTLEMWTAAPAIALSPSPGDIDILPNSIRIAYATEGATITAFQIVLHGGSDVANWETIPVGRGQVINGVATLNYVNQPWINEPILLSFGKVNAVSVNFVLEHCTNCDLR
jgi:hypothetical protein